MFVYNFIHHCLLGISGVESVLANLVYVRSISVTL